MPSRTTSMTTIAATHLLPNQPTALIISTMSGRSSTAFMHAVIIDEVEDGDDRSGDRSDDRSEHLQPSFTTSSRPGSWSSSRAPPIRPCSIVPPGQHGQSWGMIAFRPLGRGDERRAHDVSTTSTMTNDCSDDFSEHLQHLHHGHDRGNDRRSPVLYQPGSPTIAARGTCSMIAGSLIK